MSEFEGTGFTEFEPPHKRRRADQDHASPAIDMLVHKVSRLSTDMTSVMTNMTQLTAGMTALIRIEERQQQIVERLSDGTEKMKQLDDRVRDVELAMPQLVETRKWVIGGVLAGVGMIGAALLKLVMIT
jgi:ElaB/YqjD/DUF883 family membrane-anchored ribosome-binding protein